VNGEQRHGQSRTSCGLNNVVTAFASNNVLRVLQEVDERASTAAFNAN